MPILTDFLKLFKWDTASETDLEEEFDVDTSMNENWDKLDTKVKEHDDNISQNTSTIEQLQETIKKQQESMINLSTEENTSLYVDDASTVPAKLTIKGNHRQETQDGTDNLAVLTEGTIEQNGLTVNIQNGEVTMSGTNTSGALSVIKIGTAYLYQGQTYYFNRTGAMYNYGTYITIDGVANQHWTTGEQEASFTCEKTGEWDIIFSVGVNQSPTGSFKLMLSKESEAEWVQGKKTIPSIEYPSKIETVKDEVNVVVSNNLETSQENKKYTINIQQEMLKGDDFDLENNKEVHNWKKKIFDGTESWAQSSVASSVFYVDLDITKVSSKLDLVSDQYIFGGLITSTTQCENNKSYAYKTSETSNSARIYVTNNNFTTLESFKNALSEKNMTLYYIAATQTQLDLTETQKQQLAQLNNLDIFKGINNIYTEEGIALMQLDYVADTKMYIDNLLTQNTTESEG